MVFRRSHSNRETISRGRYGDMSEGKTNRKRQGGGDEGRNMLT